MFASSKHIGSGRTALIEPTETVLVVLWAFLFLGERLSCLQWIGACMIGEKRFQGKNSLAFQVLPGWILHQVIEQILACSIV
jgi:hypothetical protein